MPPIGRNGEIKSSSRNESKSVKMDKGPNYRKEDRSLSKNKEIQNYYTPQKETFKI